MSFWQIFEAAVERWATRTAVELQRPQTLARWSYRELHDAALARASWLAARGVAAGDRCAILADNDPAWCATYLGILRLGAIVVPLDTNYSPAQVATIVSDASPRCVFVNDRLSKVAGEGLASRSATIVADIHETLPPPAKPLSPSPAGDAHTAIILYTSGTTSDPKGVVLSHGNLIAERNAACQTITVSEHDSVLGVLPLFHALAQLANLLLPFAAGARVVFLETLNSTELVRALVERQITIVACLPQVLYLIHQRMMQEVARGRTMKRRLFRVLLGVSIVLRRVGINLGPSLFGRVHAMLGRQLRFFVTGGSTFEPAIGCDFYALGFTILQAYGLTETSGAATISQRDEAYLDTVGRALPGQALKTLPPEDHDLDGEIVIRGPIVMQGYYNRPDATAAVMRDGWLLTGDLGRLDTRGRLRITGRKKDVIVLASGRNIYPEKIEASYRRPPFIKEICVMGLIRDGGPTTERLFAVVVPDLDLMKERRIVNAGDLLRFEMEGQSIHLPPHKRVLGYEVWFDPLPRTTTGTIKRHEIEKCLRHKGRGAPAAVMKTSTDWQGDAHAEAVAAILIRRTRGAAVTRAANLELDLGLDSMERVELIAELEQRIGVRVDEEQVHQIFTVGQLIDAVKAGEARRGRTTAEDSWAVMLRDLPPATDPVLSGLLEPKPVATAAFFVTLRLLRLLFPRLTVTGVDHLPATGPCIITPNHQGYLDPFLMCSVLPYRLFKQLFFVGAAEYFETPLTRWLARQGNLVPVDPDAKLVPAMKASAFGLTCGRVLVLFPEGERSIDGTVKRFKKGALILSRHLRVPIVPVAIHGAFELWPRNRGINWKLLTPFSGHRVRLAFGPPVILDAADDAQAASALREKVVELWSTIRSS